MAERATEYSVFAAPFVERRVARAWGMRDARCEYWGRHVHDTYRVASGSRRAYLRVYRRGWRTLREIGAEVALLGFLRREGLRVPEPLPRKGGGFVEALRAAEGTRHAVLFAKLRGAQPAMDPANSRAYGKLAATFHRLADRYPGPLDRPATGFDALVDAPLEQIAGLWRHRGAEVASLRAVARELRAELAPRLGTRTPHVGLCHGDLHFGNVLRDARGRLALLDFDCAGYGWRAHDLSVFLWSRGWDFTREAERARRSQWEAFVEGYGTVRALERGEVRCAELLVPLHQLWVMGLWARLRPGFGQRWLTDAHFDTYVAFVQGWMRRLGG